MADSEAQLRERYAAVPVPSAIKTGELDADPVFIDAKNTFVDATIAALQLGRAASFLLEIKVSPLLPLDEQHLPESQRHTMTDDYYTRLRVAGEQTLIAIERSRTDSNFMVVQFTKHPLEDSTVKRILAFTGQPRGWDD